MTNPAQSLTWQTLRAEPFRVFFVAATLAGLGGVALWPLHFAGVVPFYPGQAHARIMTYGFFGGFIIGFLGTALPRMLSVKPLGLANLGLLFVLHAAMVLTLLGGRIYAGDVLFLGLLSVFAGSVVLRARHRKDIPPPGFVLVALALTCAAAGAVLSLWVARAEDAFFLTSLQRLLTYQAFVLLPILGVGAFLLPRFFGADSRHDFPESLQPPAGWVGQALVALGAGLAIVGSLVAEAAGWLRIGPAIRALVASWYLVQTVPFYRPTQKANALSGAIRIALVLLLSGFVTTVVLPEFRVSLLHLTLVGGFAIITFTIATRVVYGHSGNQVLLTAPNRWLTAAVALMLLAMATRMSGDFWPKLLQSHYSYGAILWIVGVLIWSARVLPKVLRADPDD